MIESRAYDDRHGDPVAVVVITGTHDLSRFMNLMAGNRVAVIELMKAGQHLLRQVRRHNGGRAALSLLRKHGGPDFTESSDDSLLAELEQARDVLRRVAEISPDQLCACGDCDQERPGMEQALADAYLLATGRPLAQEPAAPSTLHGRPVVNVPTGELI